MIQSQNNKDKKSILKKASITLIIVGVAVFFVGFMLQFVSIATMAGSTTFEAPTNYFVVIITGFALLFVGVMLGVVDSMMKAKSVQESISSTIHETILTGMRERMQQPAEIYCNYCGTLLHDGERECPNCGAGRTKK